MNFREETNRIKELICETSDLKFKRRKANVERFLMHVMEYLTVCDYEDKVQFFIAVLFSVREDEMLSGNESFDGKEVSDFIEDNYKEEIYNYYEYYYDLECGKKEITEYPNFVY
jgi:hypothetical protein